MNYDAFRNISYGVYIVTSWDNERPTGCVANSIMQVTAEPPTIAVSMNHDNFTHECMVKNGKFAINVMSEKTPSEIIGVFGYKSGRDVDKFENLTYDVKDGMPIILEGNTYLTCEIINKMESETHTVFLAKVIECDVLDKEPSMTYDYYHRVVKGKSPKNAPTYIPDSEVTEKSEEPKYVCSVCGYVYDGEIPFEELPEDYVCPICKKPKSVFELR